MTDESFLARWSRRKVDRTEEPAPRSTTATASAQAPAAAPAPPVPLPPIETLTFDSDITAFMKPHVDAALKREAIKTIVRDPRFNVMDGLDVYIDDYSIADPIPPDWLAKLNQVARLGDYKEPPADESSTEEPAANTSQTEGDGAETEPSGVADAPLDPAPPEGPEAASIPSPPVQES